MNQQGFNNILSTRAGDIDFTTDNTVNFVTLDKSALPATMFPGNVSNAHFAEGEGILIESIGLLYPYQFTWAETLPSFEFAVENRGGSVAISLDELGSNGIVNVPWVNSMFDVNIFIPYKPTLADDFVVQCIDLQLGQVSMQNMPAALNSKLLDVFILMKVVSTLEMLA